MTSVRVCDMPPMDVFCEECGLLLGKLQGDEASDYLDAGLGNVYCFECEALRCANCGDIASTPQQASHMCGAWCWGCAQVGYGQLGDVRRKIDYQARRKAGLDHAWAAWLLRESTAWSRPKLVKSRVN